MSLEQIILIAALKLPVSSLLVTAAAISLSSVGSLPGLTCVLCSWITGSGSLPQAAMRFMMMLLRFLFARPLFCLARITEPKGSSSFHANLSFGSSMTFLVICLHDCLAARGMRLICLTQTGCESTSLGDGIAVAGA